MDYYKILKDCEKAEDDGFKLTDEQRKIAMEALTGLQNFIRQEAKGTAVELTQSSLKWNTWACKNQIRDKVKDKLLDIADYIVGFQALASLGYKPSHDINRVLDAESWVVDFMITAEEDEDSYLPYDLFAMYEKSAFLPCEYQELATDEKVRKAARKYYAKKEFKEEMLKRLE